MSTKEEKEYLVNVLKFGLCGCYHKDGKNLAQEPHTCPFAEDIHGSQGLCNCCADCEYECAMDI